MAFCDVNEGNTAKPYGSYESAIQTYKEYPDVPRFKDYRLMFNKMGKEIEAVSIATPDHMH